MSHLKFIDLPPLLGAHGVVRLPGSKSISNRVLLLSALSRGVTKIQDLLHSDDTECMLQGLRTLGVKIEVSADRSYVVHGCGGDFPVKDAQLFLGNAGTAFRPLTAALALAGGHYQLSGVPRMHERPIADLVNTLRELGANIHYLGSEGFPPLEIHPATTCNNEHISVRGDVSSQFLSALLLALPLIQSSTTVTVEGELISKPYIEITIAMMARFGVQVARSACNSFTIPANSHYTAPTLICVEGDASSASYFLAAGVIGGGPVRVEGVGRDSIQGDVHFIETLQSMGARTKMGPDWMEACAPENGRIRGVDLDCNHIPDAAMTLAMCALFADGVTTLRNIASWRVKETNRIAAMAAELRKLGAQVEEGVDFIRITPSSFPSSPASIETYDDHRMAMCFSLAAFGRAGVRIMDPQCVNKTFPDYFQCFASIATVIPVIAIDGPSASGKGTVAQIVATRLGFHYLDSGALYRLLALTAQQNGVAHDAQERLANLATSMEICFKGSEIWLNGTQVSEVELRSEQMATAAAKIATLPAVRTALLDRQHAFHQAPGLVADGRDMASTVFPGAPLKIFLTASAEVRAERRYKQLIKQGVNVSITQVLSDIHARDVRDSERSIAPLQQSLGASLLDTTDLTIEQAVQEVLTRYQSVSST